MSDMQQIINALTAPPEPAIEVLTLDRKAAEEILNELEEKDPLRPIVTYLRRALTDPPIALWAMHSVGPGEVSACLSKEDAEHRAQAVRDACADAARRNNWDMGPITIDVIPSPWEPAQHFEECAIEWKAEADRLRALAIKTERQKDTLLTAAKEALSVIDRIKPAGNGNGTQLRLASAIYNATR
ncbi:hypothetical protein [Pseudomonas lactis]|uniref:Uncharacterized protein n=1 Tax=Pseudomonas lactis TaxID=1615674 RepID=A0A7Y1Q8L5_9PSED|nr:hypothetical protein [Pseudomonas lactis]NNA72150.1 hypothetical protein [Pseudomonas lactis]NNA82822.1 hypothetical protein [Pseudomonas lactis]